MIWNALIVMVIITLLYFNLHDKLINDKQENLNGKGISPDYPQTTVYNLSDLNVLVSFDQTVE